MLVTPLDCVCVSGEMNNGIKKEGLVKDGTRIWMNEGIKVPNFSHSLVNRILILKRHQHVKVERTL